MEPGSEDWIRQLRESVERREQRFGGWWSLDALNASHPRSDNGFELPDRIGFPLLIGFIWFWCSFMSFGAWALFFGGPTKDGEDALPWPRGMYLGIPVAAAFGGLVAFIVFRGIRVPWRRK